MRGIIALPLAALTLTALAGCATDDAGTARPAAQSTGPAAASANATPTTVRTYEPSAEPTHEPEPAAEPTPTATPTPTAPAVHFDTPEAAMRYLADAYNRHDLAALKKVTNPAARDALEGIRDEAVNLRLESCERQDAGDYLCEFRHEYPAGYTEDHESGDEGHEDGYGHAGFIVAPADAPGWYMTVLEYCG